MLDGRLMATDVSVYATQKAKEVRWVRLEEFRPPRQRFQNPTNDGLIGSKVDQYRETIFRPQVWRRGRRRRRRHSKYNTYLEEPHDICILANNMGSTRPDKS